MQKVLRQEDNKEHDGSRSCVHVLTKFMKGKLALLLIPVILSTFYVYIIRGIWNLTEVSNKEIVRFSYPWKMKSQLSR